MTDGKKDGMRVIFVYADSPSEWNCSQWRSLTPSDAINRSENHTAKLIHVSGFEQYLNPVIQEIVASSDLIVFQRNLVRDLVYEAMQYWQGMGKPVAVDLDDAYHVLPWSNPAHRFWHELGGDDKENLQALEKGLRLSDGLVAPNRLLLADWAYATKGYYLQNYAEKKWWESLPAREELKAKRDLSDKITIGWGGSVSHYDSWHGSGIMEAATRISEKYPDVRWMICGNDARIFDHLNVPKDQKIIQPGVPPEKWPEIVKHFDIGVAPLFGPYDQRRSWIKGLEYLLAGVPWIATRGEPYRDLADWGTLIPNGPESWQRAIEYKIDNLKREQEIAESRVEMAKQWYADNQVEHMMAVFQSIVDDFRMNRGALMLPGIARVQGKRTSENGDNAEPELSTTSEPLPV